MEFHALRCWSIVESDDYSYQQDNQHQKYIMGLKNGTRVRTSPIAYVNGRCIVTKSHNVYYLDDVDPEYLKWLKEHNITYDEHNPIKKL